MYHNKQSEHHFLSLSSFLPQKQFQALFCNSVRKDRKKQKDYSHKTSLRL